MKTAAVKKTKTPPTAFVACWCQKYELLAAIAFFSEVRSAGLNDCCYYFPFLKVVLFGKCTTGQKNINGHYDLISTGQ